MDTQQIKDNLTTFLLKVIDGDLSAFYDLDGQLIPLKLLDPNLVSIIEDYDINNNKVKLEKFKAITLLTKLTGLGSETLTLEGNDAKPLTTQINVKLMPQPEKRLDYDTGEYITPTTEKIESNIE